MRALAENRLAIQQSLPNGVFANAPLLSQYRGFDIFSNCYRPEDLPFRDATTGSRDPLGGAVSTRPTHHAQFPSSALSGHPCAVNNRQRDAMALAFWICKRHFDNDFNAREIQRTSCRWF